MLLNSNTSSCVICLLHFKADKEFVWSLWRQLQVDNPNVTQVIGQVLQRYYYALILACVF
jgi:hypothetical protein